MICPSYSYRLLIMLLHGIRVLIFERVKIGGSVKASFDGQSRSLIPQWGCTAAVICVESTSVDFFPRLWLIKKNNPQTLIICLLFPCLKPSTLFDTARDFADVTFGQWNLTLCRTVSALTGYSLESDSFRDRQGPSAPLSGPEWRSPLRLFCPPRPLLPLRPGLRRRRPRCSSTACTAASEWGWGPGPPDTVTPGTRRCWRRRWRL